MGSKNPRNVPAAHKNPPFYKRKWFIILMLVLFAPIGIFLLWKYWGGNSKSDKWLKWIVSALAGLIFLTALIPTDDAESPDVSSLPDDTSSSITSSLPEESSEESADRASTESSEDPGSSSSDSAVASSAPNANLETSGQPGSADGSESSNASEPEGHSESAPDEMANIVFWGNTGEKYHINPDCRSFKGNAPNSGTIAQAKSYGRTSWCGICSKGWTDERLEKEGNPYVK